MRYFIFLIFLTGSIQLIAQQGASEQPLPFNLQDNLDVISNLSAGSVGGIGYDLRYEGVKGTPYLLDDWAPAIIKIDGKYFEDEKVVYIVNLEKNMIVAKFNDQLFNSFPITAFEEIHFKKGGNVTPFTIMPIPNPGKYEQPVKVFEILHNGEYKFLKQHQKLFKKADYQGAYSSDVRYDEYRLENQYYIQDPAGTLHKIRLKKKAITKALPALAKKMEAFAKKHKANFSKELEVISFFQILEES